MSKKAKKRPLVEVVWRDSVSSGQGQWHDLSSHLKNRYGQKVHTVGTLIVDDKDGVGVAGDIHGHRAANVTFIPKGCILRRRRLR